ncbi:hypothetical protein [Methyloceanibacter sp.]|uniref:hypothetical protein n=1 Tax=Methyloceanibacter sp. TaxID=1965321 RepID=UPI002D4A5DAF|nr:hypothetical protein [Methyloceanibacter sp.]HZP09308.1 hypothetical protein [Methyloceanibacter sp.]
MNREELNEALLRFGGDLERWPEGKKEAASLLVASDPTAARMLADFAAFERTLADAVRPAPFGAGEIGGVLQALDATEASWSPTPRFWIASAGLSALSFAAGFAAMMMASAQDVSPSLIDFASGQANFGGLL